MRVDKLLWYLRLARTRGLAQQWVEEGRVRIDGARALRASAPVGVGALVVVKTPAGLRALRLLSLPARRGPAAEARSHYAELPPPAPAA